MLSAGYTYLFGPVPSRRLGMSLGIDLVPHKVCSLNCVYCECGPTTKLTTVRREYVPYDGIVTDLDRYMQENPRPDYLTFSGSGEPLLNRNAGRIIRYIKAKYPKIPVAVLTNGTPLTDPDVRKEIMEADLVLPSLDSASQQVFRKINRPPKTLDIQTHIEGLAEFRKNFPGKMFLEVFILPGYNDTPEELSAISQAIQKIQPDRVQLNTLDRPGAVEGLIAATHRQLEEIRVLFRSEITEIIASAPKHKNISAYRQDVETAITGTIARRPCTLEDLSHILGLHPNETGKYLDILLHDEIISIKRMKRGLFYLLNPKKLSHDQ